jgi:WS/DGAT/MGAT family acyltransferase
MDARALARGALRGKMARYHYERLSALDATYLTTESARRFGHSTSVLFFEAGPLAKSGGGIDIDAIRRAIEARLAQVPRYRQRLKWIPIEDFPVWVDDAEFNLDYHLRHTSLPHPGSPAQLDRLVARVHAQRLDRNRPLWECWVAEGLGGGRFALLVKAHHCLVPTPGQPDLLQMLLSPDAQEPEPAIEAFTPRPPPTSLELARDELLRRIWLPQRAARRFRRFARESRDLRHELMRRAEAVAKLAGLQVRQNQRSPFAGPTGPHRRFEHRALSLATAQEVRRALGGSVNDVVLSIVAGAVHRFLRHRLVSPATVDFRLALPVRRDDGRERSAAFAQWMIELPVWERDPLRRLARIREQTRAHSVASPVLGARTLFTVAEWAGSQVLSAAARELALSPPSDIELTYVPGAERPLFLRGARLLRGYGCAPLRPGNALAIAIFSFEGQLCFGLNADFDALPDLSRFGEALEESLEELRRASDTKPPRLALLAS